MTSLAASAKEKEPEIISIEQVIDADIGKAWQVLGPGYATIHQWASMIKNSEALDSLSVSGSLCTLRSCKVKGLGNVQEMIKVYSESDHVLKYEVIKGLPGMVKNATGTWKLTDEGNGKTKLSLQLEMRTGGLLGGVMKGILKKKMTKMYSDATEDFKYFVENGNPHPRKVN